MGRNLSDVLLEALRTDGGTQAREAMSDDTVAEYADRMREGAEFPPVVVFKEGTETAGNVVYWLADGFHRAAAAKLAGMTSIRAEIHQGGRRAAILHAVGANASHGLRRTNADKRRAVIMLLEDEEWRQWSSRAIADAVGVSSSTVGIIRDELAAAGRIDQSTIRKGRDGRTIDTAGITGRKPDVVHLRSSSVAGEAVCGDEAGTHVDDAAAETVTCDRCRPVAEGVVRQRNERNEVDARGHVLRTYILQTRGQGTSHIKATDLAGALRQWANMGYGNGKLETDAEKWAWASVAGCWIPPGEGRGQFSVRLAVEQQKAPAPPTSTRGDEENLRRVGVMPFGWEDAHVDRSSGKFDKAIKVLGDGDVVWTDMEAEAPGKHCRKLTCWSIRDPKTLDTTEYRTTWDASQPAGSWVKCTSKRSKGYVLVGPPMFLVCGKRWAEMSILERFLAGHEETAYRPLLREALDACDDVSTLDGLLTFGANGNLAADWMKEIADKVDDLNRQAREAEAQRQGELDAEAAVRQKIDPDDVDAIKRRAREIKKTETAERQAKERARVAELAEEARQVLPSLEGVKLVHGDIDDVLADVEYDACHLVNIDAPWRYERDFGNGSIEDRYPTLPLDVIASHIDDSYSHAADDAYALVHITSPILLELATTVPEDDPNGDETMSLVVLLGRWQAVTMLTWTKTDGIGVGVHARGDHEHVIVCRKGNPKPLRALSSVYSGPRGEHSEKPEEWCRDLVETYCPEGGIVLDLYAGLGSMALASAAKGRRYIGAEVDEARYNRAIVRIREALGDSPLFAQASK